MTDKRLATLEALSERIGETQASEPLSGLDEALLFTAFRELLFEFKQVRNRP